MRPRNRATLAKLSRVFGQTADGLTELSKSASQVGVPANVVLIEEEERSTTLFVVVAGDVELFSSRIGHEMTMDYVRPVAPLLLGSVLCGSRYPLAARTLTETQLIKIPARKVRAVFRRNVVVARSLGFHLAARCDKTWETLKILKYRRNVAKLAHYIIEEHNRQGGLGQLRLPLPKKVLASLLGITPETLSRVFSRLKQHGVKVRGDLITLSKLHDLEVLAKTDCLSNDCQISQPELGSRAN